jgi:hypothetical protein
MRRSTDFKAGRCYGKFLTYNLDKYYIQIKSLFSILKISSQFIESVENTSFKPALEAEDKYIRHCRVTTCIPLVSVPGMGSWYIQDLHHVQHGS